jgi:hypothetical protein
VSFPNVKASLLSFSNIRILPDPTSARKLAQIKEAGATRHQAVFAIDMKMWEDLIDAFNITEPLIPDRGDQGVRVSSTGWYG